MKKLLSSIGVLGTSLWATLAFAACPTGNPQTIEAYVFGCPAATPPYSSSLMIPAVPNSTTAPTSSLIDIPANTLVDTSTAQTVAGVKTFSSAPTLSSITGSTQCLQVNSSGVISGSGAICSSGGGSGLSGMTAGQVPIAATASTVTSSKPLSNTSAATIATTAGTLTNGHCVSINGTGDFVDAGGSCTTGGGGGTVNSGTAPQATYYATTGTAVSGNPNVSFPSGLTALNYTGGTLPAALNGTNLQIGGAAATTARIEVDAFGTAAQPSFTARAARGTVGVPSAVQLNDVIGSFHAFGYGATGYSATSRAAMALFAAENWTDTAQGAGINFNVTTPGTLTSVQEMQLTSSGAVMAGATGGAQGAGTINMHTGCFVDGVSCAGATTITLSPGFASTPGTYNPGTQTVSNGQTLSPQLFYESHTISCTLNSTCGSTNDSGKLMTATAPSVTFTTPAPGTVGTAVYNFGYDAVHTYTLTTPSGNIYGNCGTTGATLAGIAFGVSLTTDGTNWQCTPYGASGGGSYTGWLPGAGLSSTRTAGGAGSITNGATAYVDTSYFPFFMGGCVLSNDGTTPATIIDISACVAADDTNAYMIKVAAFTKTTGAFAAGTGLGGLDTGTVASGTWYYVFAIMQTGGTSDILLSASATSPTMPSGYTLKRLIGAISTCTTQLCSGASTTLATFKQRGTEVIWNKGGTVLDVNSSALGTSATLETLPSVPPSIQVKPKCRYYMSNAAAAAVLLTSPDEADVAPSTADPATTSPGFSSNQLATTLTAGVQNSVCPFLVTNTSGQIRARATAASTTIAIDVTGFSY